MYAIAALVVVAMAIAVWAYVHYEPNFSLNRVLDLFGTYGYFVIFIPVLLETAGLPLPGETILLISARSRARWPGARRSSPGTAARRSSSPAGSSA